MCEVLDRVENKGIEKGIERGMKQGIEKGMKQGVERGMKQGIERGESSAFGLVQYLLSNGRMEDLKKVSEDVEYRSRLMKELFPEKE